MRAISFLTIATILSNAGKPTLSAPTSSCSSPNSNSPKTCFAGVDDLLMARNVPCKPMFGNDVKCVKMKFTHESFRDGINFLTCQPKDQNAEDLCKYLCKSMKGAANIFEIDGVECDLSSYEECCDKDNCNAGKKAPATKCSQEDSNSPSRCRRGHDSVPEKGYRDCMPSIDQLDWKCIKVKAMLNGVSGYWHDCASKVVTGESYCKYQNAFHLDGIDNCDPTTFTECCDSDECNA